MIRQEQMQSKEDFTAKILKISKIEELFSKQLRALSTNEFERRIFSLKEVI